jgi:hypothetical protein
VSCAVATIFLLIETLAVFDEKGIVVFAKITPFA